MVGKGWRGLDSYVSGKLGAEVLATNLGGQTPRERSREIAGLRSARPDLKKAVGHLILSHDPTLPDLTPEQWRTAIEIAREEHGLRDAAFLAVLHTDVDHRHVHAIFLRVRPDASVVSDSHSYRKNEAAARRIESELSLPPPRASPRERRSSDRGSVDRARQRAERKQHQLREVHMDRSELERVVVEAMQASDSVEGFNVALRSAAVEFEWSANNAGLKVRPEGSTTWLKASSVSRALSAAKIVVTLERNAELRRAAKDAGKSAIDAATSRAAAIADAAALPPVVGTSRTDTRALAPSAARAAVVEMSTPTAGDPLAFLATAPAPRLAGQPLDDAALVSQPAEAEAEVDADTARAAREAERDQAEATLDRELRRMSVAALLDVKSAGNVEPVELQVERLLALLSLMLRILSFGLVKKSNALQDARVVRQALADRASDELQRRKRTPNTVAERLRAIDVEATALGGRRDEIHARAVKRQVAGDTPATVARARVQRAYDAERARAGLPTLAARRQLVDTLTTETATLEGERAQAEADIPRGFGAALGGMVMVDGSRHRLQERLRDVQRKLDMAQARRKRFAAELDLLLAEFERRVREQIEGEIQAVKASLDAERLEVEQIEIELRTTIPLERRAAERNGVADRMRDLAAGVEVPADEATATPARGHRERG